MKRIIIGAAALAAVAVPTTTFAVYNSDEDPLDTYEMERLAIDTQAPAICEAVRDELLFGGLDVDEMVDVGVDAFAEGWGPDFPTDMRLYVAGIIIGCASS